MTTRFYLYHLAKSSLKKRLLGYFFLHPEASLYLREIAVLLNVDPANLSREFGRLGKEGIFSSKKRGNQKYFSLNRTYPLYQELESMVTKTIGKLAAAPVLPTRTKLREQASIYVIAGPNGSGKTTFAKEFLPEYVKCKQFINADLIAGGLAPFSPDQAALRAGRLLLEQIKLLSDRGEDFGFETTLAGKSYVKTLRELKSRGYHIHLIFLWIPNVELSLARIEDRVRRGGHRIPEPVVRRRFHKGIRHLFTLYRPLLDSWTLFDNSGPAPHLIATEEGKKLIVIDQPLFDRIRKTAEAS